MTSKELDLIPANAELIEEFTETDRKISNTVLFLISSFPATAFYGMGLDGSFGDITIPIAMGWMLMLMTFGASPFENTGIQQTETKSFKQFLKLRLVKFPIVSRLINEDIEWTETDYYGIEKDQKRLTVVRKGKVSVYNLPIIDPKEIWDRMYKEETGEDIAKSIAYHKTVRKFSPSIETRKSVEPGSRNQPSFLRKLLG